MSLTLTFSLYVGSASWGEAGYIRVAMKGDGIGQCGMYQENYHAPTTFTKTLSGRSTSMHDHNASTNAGDCTGLQ